MPHSLVWDVPTHLLGSFAQPEGKGKKNTLVSKKSQIQPANVTVPGERKKKKKNIKTPHNLSVPHFSYYLHGTTVLHTRDKCFGYMCIWVVIWPNTPWWKPNQLPPSTLHLKYTESTLLSEFINNIPLIKLEKKPTFSVLCASKSQYLYISHLTLQPDSSLLCKYELLLVPLAHILERSDFCFRCFQLIGQCGPFQLHFLKLAL